MQRAPSIHRRLTAVQVKHSSKRGYLCDGNGLYLQISAAGHKSWVFRYKFGGRRRERGLGSLCTVSLRQARQAALECHYAVSRGLDPIVEVQKARVKARIDAANAITFKECARRYIDSRAAEWKSAKHGKQWLSTLETYAYPVFGNLSVQEVDTHHITKVLSPIWSDKAETAKRLRQRIELVLKWATALQYRTGENPARMSGHLDTILGKAAQKKRVQHHKSMPHKQVGEFMRLLRAQDSGAAAALELVILTAARTNEVLGARWEEIDFDGQIWVIPANRMKVGVEHVIPLSLASVAIFERMKKVQQNDFVFPGAAKGRPLSNMAMLKLRDRMDRRDVTIHGFRGTFRTWAADCTNFSVETVERALAHTVKNKAEAAYNTTTQIDKRRALMEMWAQYCSRIYKESKNVVHFDVHRASAVDALAGAQ